MDASVTLKFSPAEFDTTREALRSAKAEAERASKTQEYSAADRRLNAAEAVKIGLILERLQ